MSKNTGKIIKRSCRSAAASFPYFASLAQWWSEIEQERFEDNLQTIKGEIEEIRNPIPNSHPRALIVIEMIFAKIQSVESLVLEVDEELRENIEVLNLWEKEGYLSGVHEIGNMWIMISLEDPFFVMAVYSTVKGNSATINLKQTVWDLIRKEGKGVDGEIIAEKVGVSIAFVDSLFSIFEKEGKGWKSREGNSYFATYPELY